jgi:hypothetical protein
VAISTLRLLQPEGVAITFKFQRGRSALEQIMKYWGGDAPSLFTFQRTFCRGGTPLLENKTGGRVRKYLSLSPLLTSFCVVS